MNSRIFKTPKGTELPIFDFEGKDYLQVRYRLVWFREDHPSWSIETEFLKLESNYAIAKAAIKTQDGRILATAHKAEDTKGFADFPEKAETGAIGRALALVGYGTQFCGDELDEGERIVDSPTGPIKPKPRASSSSASHSVNDRLGLSLPSVQPASPVITPVDHKAISEVDSMTEERKIQQERIMKVYQEFMYLRQFTPQDMPVFLKSHFGTEDTRKMSIPQLKVFADLMEEETRRKHEPKLPDHPLDHFKIIVGNMPPKGLKGKTFKEAGREALGLYAKHTHDFFLREKKAMSKEWQDFFQKAEEWVFGSVNSLQPESPPDVLNQSSDSDLQF